MYHIYTVFALFFKTVITIEKQSEWLRFKKNYKDLVTYVSLQNRPVVLLLVVAVAESNYCLAWKVLIYP